MIRVGSSSRRHRAKRTETLRVSIQLHLQGVGGGGVGEGGKGWGGKEKGGEREVRRGGRVCSRGMLLREAGK